MNPIDDTLIEDEEERFLHKLKSFDGIAYFFQKDRVLENRPCHGEFLQTLVDSKNYPYEKYDSKGLPLIHGMDLDGVKHYTYTELKLMTGSFSESNCICKIPFGRLFRGTIIHEEDSRVENVMVKTWNFLFPPRGYMSKHPARLHDELRLLRNPKIKSHPNVAKLIGFHCERTLAVIYEGGGGSSSMNLLKNMIPSDKFCWNDRMKVATEVGNVLKTFHDNKHVQGGVTSGNILVDEAYNPMIFNFLDHGHYGFDSKWCSGYDVCAFGRLLLHLIKKEDMGDRTYGEWILAEKLAVHNSFGIEEHILSSVKELSVKCFEEGRSSRETTTVVPFLEELKNLVDATLPNERHNFSN